MRVSLLAWSDLPSMLSEMLQNPVIIGSAALFISFCGGSLTFPFLQSQRDKLGCDALCYGTMQSARSALSMVGTVLVGRFSDRYGRKTALFMGILASITTYIISYLTNDIMWMWMSMVPSALLNQNFGVMKAYFADLGIARGHSESELASAVGKLGMAAGFSFMLGPLAAATLFTSYHSALQAALVSSVIAAALLTRIPEPSKVPAPLSNGHRNDKDKEKKEQTAWASVKAVVRNFIHLSALKLPGIHLLLFMRAFMGLAFQIFMVVWTVSLKSRFSFGPKEHALFMSWIGLCYSLSQGYLAKVLIRTAGEDPTSLLQLCMVVLGGGRWLAMQTQSVVLVYILMAAVIVALGVVNTSISAACARLAKQDELGGLYGVFEAVESLAGLIGPGLGGVIQRVHPALPMLSVLLIYGAIFLAVHLRYRDYVVRQAVTPKLSGHAAAVTPASISVEHKKTD